MSKKINVALFGLGKVGSTFLNKLVEFDGKTITIVAVAEKDANASGLKIAQDRGIKVYSDQQIIDMGDDVDIIFELTGNSEARRSLRMAMVTSNNSHTVIAPEIMAFFVWNLMTEEENLPEAHIIKGY